MNAVLVRRVQKKLPRSLEICALPLVLSPPLARLGELDRLLDLRHHLGAALPGGL